MTEEKKEKKTNRVITNLWSRRCTGPNVKASTKSEQYCSSISGDESATAFCSCVVSMLQRPATASPCEKILREYWNIGQTASLQNACCKIKSSYYMDLREWKGAGVAQPV
jgi:hypothetical protein